MLQTSPCVKKRKCEKKLERARKKVQKKEVFDLSDLPKELAKQIFESLKDIGDFLSFKLTNNYLNKVAIEYLQEKPKRASRFLTTASEQGFIHFVKELLSVPNVEIGIDIILLSSKEEITLALLEHKKLDNHSDLHDVVKKACIQGFPAVVRTLISQTNVDSWKPFFHAAIKHHHLEVFDILIQDARFRTFEHIIYGLKTAARYPDIGILVNLLQLLDAKLISVEIQDDVINAALCGMLEEILSILLKDGRFDNVTENMVFRAISLNFREGAKLLIEHNPLLVISSETLMRTFKNGYNSIAKHMIKNMAVQELFEKQMLDILNIAAMNSDETILIDAVQKFLPSRDLILKVLKLSITMEREVHVKFLIRNIDNIDWERILRMAIKNNYKSLIKFILNENSDRIQIQSVLKVAAKMKHPIILHELLSHFWPTNIKIFQSALHSAVRHKRVQNVSVLFDFSKDLRVSAKVIILALENWHPEVFDFLLYNVKAHSMLSAAIDFASVLYAAVRIGDPVRLRKLLVHDDIFIPVFTTLEYAVHKNAAEIVEILLENGHADPSEGGDSLIVFADDKGMDKIVDLLYNDGRITVPLKIHFKITAKLCNFVELDRLLTLYGQGEHFFNILTQAITDRNSDLVKFLLPYKPSIDNNKLLDLAITQNDFDTVELLLQYTKIIPEANDLINAAYAKDSRIAQALITDGRIDLRNSTFLEAMITRNRVDLVKQLLAIHAVQEHIDPKKLYAFTCNIIYPTSEKEEHNEILDILNKMSE